MTRPIFVLQAYMHLLMKHCVRVDNGNAVYLGLSSTNTSKLTGSAPSLFIAPNWNHNWNNVQSSMLHQGLLYPKPRLVLRLGTTQS